MITDLIIGPISSNASLLTLNGVPSALVLTVNDDTKITLNWTIGSTNHDGHRIYISTDGVNFTEKGTVTGSTAAYQAIGLTQGTEYYFYVVAYKGSHESPATDTAHAITYSYFKITVDTTKAGSANDTFILPTAGAGTYNYYIDWGAGGAEEHIVANTSQTHDYNAPGIYQIKIRGTFPRIYFNNAGDKLKLISIDNWGNIAWSSMEKAFSGCANMNGTFTDAPNLGSATTLTQMFNGCVKFNCNLTGWNTASITNMSYMFNGCTIFNGSVSSFDTSNVDNMAAMFYSCRAFNQSVSNFNTAKVTSMLAMFYDCRLFDQSVSSFNTALVTNMSYMFSDCYVFNQSVSNFNTANVTDMSYMFYKGLAFNQSVASFNTAKVTTMAYMFELCGVFNQSLAGFNTAKVTTMQRMLYACSVFDQSLADFNVTALTNATEMLRYCTLSKANYDATLTSWADQAVKDTVTFHGGYSYTTVGGTGDAGRDHLVSTHSWTITDNGNTFDNGKILIVNDDANVGIYNNAFPVCTSEGIVGTVYVISDLVGTSGVMTWENLQTMQAAGHDIQCHSKTHTNETTLSQVQLEAELDAVTSAFTTNSLPAPAHHAYPFGAFNANVKTWVAGKRSTGRTTLASSTYKKMTTGGDKFEIPCHTCDNYTNAAIKALIDDTLVDNTGQVLLFHNIGVTGYKSTADFTEIVQYAKAQGVDIITMSDLFALLD